MSEYILRVPEKSLQSNTKTWATRSVLKDGLLKINNNYRSYIDFASKENNIPTQVIMGFIAVESFGRPESVGAGRFMGLMQWDRFYVVERLKKEFTTGRLSDNEKLLLAKHGVSFDSNGNVYGSAFEKSFDGTRNGLFTAMKKNIALKPDLNILIGTIWLGQIIDGISTKKGWAVEDDNTLRIDKIITVYNRGEFDKSSKVSIDSKLKGANVDTTTVAKYYGVVSKLNNVVADYIRKFLGKDGAMDILTDELNYLFQKK